MGRLYAFSHQALASHLDLGSREWKAGSNYRRPLWKRTTVLSRAMAASMLLAGIAQGVRAAPPLKIQVLSSRPDMVTIGTALVGVEIPTGATPAQIIVRADGKDVSSGFHQVGSEMIGLVAGLKPGKNLLSASAGSRSASLTVTAHDKNTPVISGPHQMPFICETQTFKLPDGTTMGPALDENCNAPTKVMYVYKPADGGKFRPLPSIDKLPADVATTTTLEGKTVNYIVRLQTGTLNRAIYQIAILYDPTSDPSPSPFATYKGWNRKIIYSFAGSASAGYQQGNFVGQSLTTLEDSMLSRGFAVLGSSLNVLGHSPSDALSAETASMVKEEFIKTFGVPIYTMGWGGSGGAMSQHLVANNYPGILDGIVPMGSFPDLFTTVPTGVDCSLLDNAFNHSTVKWSEDQKTAVAGYDSWAVCKSWMTMYSPNWMKAVQVPTVIYHLENGDFDTSNCPTVLPHSLTYDPKTNQRGARCDIYTGIRNLVGVDPATGQAARGFDNVGVQYGYTALKAGKIDAEQFVELNELAGGYDNEGNFQAARTTASPLALKNLYQFGRVNEGGNLDIPIIDYRTTFPGADVHNALRSLAMRARLIRARGSADNQVIIRGVAQTFAAAGGASRPGAASGAPSAETFSLLKMDEWLSNIAADARGYDTKMARTLAGKPAGLDDTCFLKDNERVVEKAQIDGTGRCAQALPYTSDPRQVAGEPLADDILKCQLKPFNSVDYPGFSASQIARLKKVFATGVCDWSKPSVGMKPLEATWLAYPSPGVAMPLR